jgi:hypothetical protein
VFGLVLEYLSEAFFENIQESVPQNLTLCFDIANAVVKFNFPRTVWNHSSPYKTCGDIETCFDYLSFFFRPSESVTTVLSGHGEETRN